MWGGAADHEPVADGASYDLAAQTWQTLPPAPLPAVRDPAFAWTGSELLVWAGTEQRATADDPEEQPIQGAAYDPRSRTWRSLSSPPLDIAYSPEAAMLGSDRVVLLTSSGGALYDLPTDTWEPLAMPAAANRSGTGLVWTGTQLLTWGGQDAASPRMAADGAAYDPATDTWTAIPAAPLAGRVGHTLTWTGEDLIVWGGMDDRLASYPDGAAYRPGDGTGDAEVLDAAAPRQGTLIGFARVEHGVLTAYPSGGEAHRLYGPGDGPAITAASLEPGSTTEAWQAIASPGAGTRPFLLLEGGQDGVSSRELDLPVSSPHVDPRPVWGPGGDVVWIEMDDEDTGRLRIARWEGGELEEAFVGALALPGDRPDPSATDEAPDWDGKSRFWLDDMWTQIDLPGAATAIGLQVSQPISEDFSNGTFSLRLERRPDGSYEIRQMAQMDG